MTDRSPVPAEPADPSSPRAPRVLLGVTGGIAAYKACELARLFVKGGVEVRVVMTQGARAFVSALTFQALTGNPVRDTLFDPAHEAAMGHIELARWPDAVVIAPASASSLARLAHGMADDLLSTLALATDKPLFAAPAMNRLMWANTATQANAAVLRSRGITLLGPGSGAQACGEVGEGRMWEPQQVFDAVFATLRADAARGPATALPLQGVKAVVTAGPTREPLDPVRFLTNRSSGKQGYAVAHALRALGAEVTLVSGPTALPCPDGVRRVEVETAQQLLNASLDAAEGAALFVGAAAVADYRAAEPAAQKLKKTGDTLTLTLVRNPDVLKAVRAAQPGLFLVGFAAETERLEEHARGKLAAKGLDLVAANWVGHGRAFDAEVNALSLFWDGGGEEIAQGSKAEVSQRLAAVIAERFHARPARAATPDAQTVDLPL